MHIAWDPRAVRGCGRIEKARLRGFYLAGTAAAYMERRAADAGREGEAAVETAEVLQGGLDGGREVSAAGSRGTKVPDERRETMVNEGGAVEEGDVVGAGGPDAQGGEGARSAMARRGSYPDGARNNHTGGHTAVAEGGGCTRPHLEGPSSCCGGSCQLSQVWIQGPEGWCQQHVGGMEDVQRAVQGVWRAPMGVWWLVRGGRVLRDETEALYEGDHIHVPFRGVGGGGEGEAGQAGAPGGPPGGEGGTGRALEEMMEMMRRQGEQLQLLAASTSGLQKEVEEFKSGKGKDKQEQEKEEPIPPITVANVEKMEGAPHLPRWMSGQCKLLKELLGGLGEEWVAEDMEGVQGGEGGGVVDSDIVLTDPEDGGGTLG